MLSRGRHLLHFGPTRRTALARHPRGAVGVTPLTLGPAIGRPRGEGVVAPTAAHTASPQTPLPHPTPSAHADVIISPVRRAFDAVLGARGSSSAVGSGYGSTSEVTGTLATDFQDLASAEEPSVEQLYDPTTSAEGVRDDRLNTTSGEEELEFVAACAVERLRAGDSAEHSDVDAVDHVDAGERWEAAPSWAGGTRRVRSNTPHYVGSAERQVEVTDEPADTFPRLSDTVDKVAFFAEYAPVNVTGELFSSDIAEQLVQAAWDKGFRSPVWGTRDGFFRRGAQVRETVDGGACGGVRVTSLQRPFTLFNVEQTNVPPTDALWQSLKNAAGCPGRTSTLVKPVDILGSFLKARVVDQLRQHPRFPQLQAVCPMWITYADIQLIGAQLPDHEAKDFVAIPLHDEVVARRLAYAREYPSEAESRQVHSQMIGVDLVRHTVLYNVHQLEDRSRFLRDPSAPLSSPSAYDGRFFRAYGLAGGRFGTAVTFLMREYCKRNYFPSAGVSLWVHERAISEFHGVLRETARTPADARITEATHLPLLRPYRGFGEWPNAPWRRPGAVPDNEDDPDCPDGVGVHAQTAVRGEVAGVVPPPFTAFVSDSVMTLYNVLHVDNRDAIVAAAVKNKRRREQFTRAPYSPKGGDGWTAPRDPHTGTDRVADKAASCATEIQPRPDQGTDRSARPSSEAWGHWAMPE